MAKVDKKKVEDIKVYLSQFVAILNEQNQAFNKSRLTNQDKKIVLERYLGLLKLHKEISGKFEKLNADEKAAVNKGMGRLLGQSTPINADVYIEGVYSSRRMREHTGPYHDVISSYHLLQEQIRQIDQDGFDRDNFIQILTETQEAISRSPEYMSEAIGLALFDESLSKEKLRSEFSAKVLDNPKVFKVVSKQISDYRKALEHAHTLMRDIQKEPWNYTVNDVERAYQEVQDKKVPDRLLSLYKHGVRDANILMDVDAIQSRHERAWLPVEIQKPGQEPLYQSVPLFDNLARVVDVEGTRWKDALQGDYPKAYLAQVIRQMEIESLACHVALEDGETKPNEKLEAEKSLRAIQKQLPALREGLEKLEMEEELSEKLAFVESQVSEASQYFTQSSPASQSEYQSSELIRKQQDAEQAEAAAKVDETQANSELDDQVEGFEAIDNAIERIKGHITQFDIEQDSTKAIDILDEYWSLKAQKGDLDKAHHALFEERLQKAFVVDGDKHLLDPVYEAYEADLLKRYKAQMDAFEQEAMHSLLNVDSLKPIEEEITFYRDARGQVSDEFATAVDSCNSQKTSVIKFAYSLQEAVMQINQQSAYLEAYKDRLNQVMMVADQAGLSEGTKLLLNELDLIVAKYQLPPMDDALVINNLQHQLMGAENYFMNEDDFKRFIVLSNQLVTDLDQCDLVPQMKVLVRPIIDIQGVANKPSEKGLADMVQALTNFPQQVAPLLMKIAAKVQGVEPVVQKLETMSSAVNQDPELRASTDARLQSSVSHSKQVNENKRNFKANVTNIVKQIDRCEQEIKMLERGYQPKFDKRGQCKKGKKLKVAAKDQLLQQKRAELQGALQGLLKQSVFLDTKPNREYLQEVLKLKSSNQDAIINVFYQYLREKNHEHGIKVKVPMTADSFLAKHNVADSTDIKSDFPDVDNPVAAITQSQQLQSRKVYLDGLQRLSSKKSDAYKKIEKAKKSIDAKLADNARLFVQIKKAEFDNLVLLTQDDSKSDMEKYQAFKMLSTELVNIEDNMMVFGSAQVPQLRELTRLHDREFLEHNQAYPHHKDLMVYEAIRDMHQKMLRQADEVGQKAVVISELELMLKEVEHVEARLLSMGDELRSEYVTIISDNHLLSASINGTLSTLYEPEQVEDRTSHSDQYGQVPSDTLSVLLDDDDISISEEYGQLPDDFSFKSLQDAEANFNDVFASDNASELDRVVAYLWLEKEHQDVRLGIEMDDTFKIIYEGYYEPIGSVNTLDRLLSEGYNQMATLEKAMVDLARESDMNQIMEASDTFDEIDRLDQQANYQFASELFEEAVEARRAELDKAQDPLASLAFEDMIGQFRAEFIERRRESLQSGAFDSVLHKDDFTDGIRHTDQPSDIGRVEQKVDAQDIQDLQHDIQFLDQKLIELTEKRSAFVQLLRDTLPHDPTSVDFKQDLINISHSMNELKVFDQQVSALRERLEATHQDLTQRVESGASSLSRDDEMNLSDYGINLQQMNAIQISGRDQSQMALDEYYDIRRGAKTHPEILVDRGMASRTSGTSLNDIDVSSVDTSDNLELLEAQTEALQNMYAAQEEMYQVLDRHYQKLEGMQADHQDYQVLVQEGERIKRTFERNLQEIDEKISELDEHIAGLAENATDDEVERIEDINELLDVIDSGNQSLRYWYGQKYLPFDQRASLQDRASVELKPSEDFVVGLEELHAELRETCVELEQMYTKLQGLYEDMEEKVELKQNYDDLAEEILQAAEKFDALDRQITQTREQLASLARSFKLTVKDNEVAVLARVDFIDAGLQRIKDDQRVYQQSLLAFEDLTDDARSAYEVSQIFEARSQKLENRARELEGEQIQLSERAREVLEVLREIQEKGGKHPDYPALVGKAASMQELYRRQEHKLQTALNLARDQAFTMIDENKMNSTLDSDAALATDRNLRAVVWQIDDADFYLNQNGRHIEQALIAASSDNPQLYNALFELRERHLSLQAYADGAMERFKQVDPTESEDLDDVSDYYKDFAQEKQAFEDAMQRFKLEWQAIDNKKVFEKLQQEANQLKDAMDRVSNEVTQMHDRLTQPQAPKKPKKKPNGLAALFRKPKSSVQKQATRTVPVVASEPDVILRPNFDDAAPLMRHTTSTPIMDDLYHVRKMAESYLHHYKHYNKGKPKDIRAWHVIDNSRLKHMRHHNRKVLDHIKKGRVGAMQFKLPKDNAMTVLRDGLSITKADTSSLKMAAAMLIDTYGPNVKIDIDCDERMKARVQRAIDEVRQERLGPDEDLARDHTRGMNPGD